MSEQNFWHYGCYQGNYEKRYKWQCKKFNSEREATTYVDDNNEKDGIKDGFTLHMSINKIYPEFSHIILLRKMISQINQVDIN
jgi:hypothetical protein